MLRKSQLIIIIIITIIALITGLIYFGLFPGLKNTEPVKEVRLNFWGVGDDSTDFLEVISDYQQLHPNVLANYRKIDEDNYEDELLNALAANEPIDIIMFKNSWLPKHFDKITPAPMAFVDFQNIFPTVAVQDFAPNQIIYALPLYIDTLAMIYNRDIFDTKGIAIPPRNWSAFQSTVIKLKKQVAIGGTEKNIKNASDLLNLLFVQSGAPMIDETFSRADFASQGDVALSFYTQFAIPKNDYSVWSDKNKYSLDSFAEEETAIIFGYHNQLKEIKDRHPFLPLKVAAVPQPLAGIQPTSWASYYGLAVPRSSSQTEEAWKFIIFLTTDQVESEKYLNAAQHPPALRSLINKKLADPELEVFANQALSARSYPQIEDNFIKIIFSNMIESVITGRLSPFSAVLEGESEITRLIQNRR